MTSRKVGLAPIELALVSLLVRLRRRSICTLTIESVRFVAGLISIVLILEVVNPIPEGKPSEQPGWRGLAWLLGQMWDRRRKDLLVVEMSLSSGQC